MDGRGTTPRTEEVGLRRERQPRLRLEQAVVTHPCISPDMLVSYRCITRNGDLGSTLGHKACNVDQGPFLNFSNILNGIQVPPGGSEAACTRQVERKL